MRDNANRGGFWNAIITQTGRSEQDIAEIDLAATLHLLVSTSCRPGTFHGALPQGEAEFGSTPPTRMQSWQRKVYMEIRDPQNVTRHPGGDGWVGVESNSYSFSLWICLLFTYYSC